LILEEAIFFSSIVAAALPGVSAVVVGLAVLFRLRCDNYLKEFCGESLQGCVVFKRGGVEGITVGRGGFPLG